jgi:putative phage-type endonuclease
MNTFNIIDVEQGTDDWHQWRTTGIGASDAPCIMGENPWNSSKQLFDEKLDKILGFSNKRRPLNAAMARGVLLEPEARATYNEEKGNITTPICIQSMRYPWMLASLDGINIDNRIAVEIKCGLKNYNFVQRNWMVPNYYYAQLQHILAICSFEKMDFYSFLPSKTPILLSIERDDAYIEKLIDSEAVFWGQITGDRPRDV